MTATISQEIYAALEAKAAAVCCFRAAVSQIEKGILRLEP